MTQIDALIYGFSVAFQYQNLLLCLVGCIVGTLVGVLPGIGPAGALAMLGPGRWSVDARLFGWKRIDLGGHVKPATRGAHQDPERGPGIR